MPAVIYIFSLCTFTFGLSEFVVAGLVSAISLDLHESISNVGSAIAAYALGAAIGAPVITACEEKNNEQEDFRNQIGRAHV